MQIYKYWASDKRKITCASTHGNAWSLKLTYEHVFSLKVGSDISQEDAERRLNLAFDEIVAWEKKADVTPDEIEEHRRRLRELYNNGEKGEYARPICEEILSEVDSRNVVTRNHYGAEVLNSEDTCFIDIDYIRMSFRENWRKIFGKLKTDADILTDRVDRLLALPENVDLGIRLYRTAQGFRMIVFGRDLAPGSARMWSLFRFFNADDLYSHLCVSQGCYRARLTPKPMRLRVTGILKCGRYPAVDAAALAAWVAKYNEKAAKFAVCKFLFAKGRDTYSPVVVYHDRVTKADSSLPLK